MKRYEIIKESIFEILESKSHGNKKIEAYIHLSNVTQLCMILANIRKLDVELAAIIGICHDIAIYQNHSHFDHANRSSFIAKQLLEKTDLFTKEQIDLICHAIACHSNKDVVDDVYSELIKDADLYSQYLQEMDAIYSKTKEKRILAIKEEFQS